MFKQAVIPLQQQYSLHVYADKVFDKLNDKWIVPMLRNVRGTGADAGFSGSVLCFYVKGRTQAGR